MPSWPETMCGNGHTQIAIQAQNICGDAFRANKARDIPPQRGIYW